MARTQMFFQILKKPVKENVLFSAIVPSFEVFSLHIFCEQLTIVQMSNTLFIY